MLVNMTRPIAILMLMDKDLVGYELGLNEVTKDFTGRITIFTLWIIIWALEYANTLPSKVLLFKRLSSQNPKPPNGIRL